MLANKAIDCRVNIVSGFIGAGNDKLFIEDSLRRSEILSKLVINFTTELLSDPSVVELISCFIVEAFTLNLLNVSKFTELLSNVVTSKINNLPGAVRFDFLMQLCDIHSYIMRIYVGGMPVVVDNLLTNLFGIPSKNKFKQLRIGQQYCTDCNPKTLYDVCDVFDAAVVESSTDDEPSQFNVGSYKKLQGDLIVSDGEYSGMSGALGLLEDLISSEATSDFEIDAQAIESEQSAPENAAPLHKSAIQKQSISEDTTEGRIIGLFNSALLKCTRRAMKLARVGGTESTIDGLVARCSKMLNLNRTNGNIYDIFESVVEFAISPSISDTLQSITAAQELLIPSNALFNETLFETPHNKYTFNSLRAIATSSQNTDNFDEVVSDGVDTNLQTLYAVYPML